MKKTERHKPTASSVHDLRPEYRFDYRKAKPNRFAGRAEGGRVVVLLDSDISRVFRDAESVNAVLRALIETMPATRRRKVVST